LQNCPPEFFPSGKLGKEADIWCFGLIFFELSKGEHPFAGCPDMTTRLNESAPRMEAPFKIAVPDDLADIVNKCLLRDPSHRFDARRLQRKVSRIPIDEVALAVAVPETESTGGSWRSIFIFLVFAMLISGALIGYKKFKPLSEKAKHSRLISDLQSDDLSAFQKALPTLKVRLPKLTEKQRQGTLQILVLALDKKDPVLRREIAKTIRLFGPEALDLLEPALKDPNLQAGVVQTLREFDVLCLPLLQRLLKSNDSSMQLGAMSLLANIGQSKDLLSKNREAFDTRRKLLFDALRHKLPPVRQIAIGAVTALALQEPKIIPQLVKLFKDPVTTNVGGDLLAGLGPKGLPHLVVSTRDPKPAIRLSAFRALVKIARIQAPMRSKVFPLLIQTFLDPDPKVKKFCVGALKGFTIEALPYLVKALPDRKLGMHVRQHIVRLGPAVVGNALMKYIADPKAGPQVQGIIRIFCIADPKTRERLFDALKKGNNTVEVTNTLVAAGPFILTTINKELFKPQSKVIILTLLTVLKRMGEKSKPSINALIKLNKDTTDEDIREASYNTLSVQKLTEAQWIPVLISNGVSSKKSLRISALSKLGAILGGPQKKLLGPSWLGFVKSSKPPERLVHMGFLLGHYEESAGKIAAVAELFATMLAKADPGAKAYLHSALKIPAQAKGAAAVLKALK
ncbi:MAG: protein kinase, partial [Planctomycetota bacterium]|nr:protein kinase [Planctomycetota bacterium]